MKNKSIIVFDVINGGLEQFDTTKEAMDFIRKEFIDTDDGIHPDIESLFIAQRLINIEVVKTGKYHNVKFIDFKL